MADTHTVSLDIPNEITVTLRGYARKLETAKLPTNVITALFEKGVQRAANDPLGNLFEKGKTPPETEVNKYWDALVAQWLEGKVKAARKGGLGRTADPVQREVKRLANAEIEASLTKLLVAHGAGGVPMARKEFDEKLRAKYVAAHLAANKDRLEREAKANLAKLAKTGEVQLLNVNEDEDESEDEDEGDEA